MTNRFFAATLSVVCLMVVAVPAAGQSAGALGGNSGRRRRQSGDRRQIEEMYKSAASSTLAAPSSSIRGISAIMAAAALRGRLRWDDRGPDLSKMGDINAAPAPDRCRS